MAKVLAVIAARLNSSRLPGKQLLDLAGEPLIARIFQRLAQVSEIDEAVLATTADDYNQPLMAWAEQTGQQAFAFGGDVNDVVGRVDAVVKNSDADIIVFCCGDSPLLEPPTLSKMIQALQKNTEIDFVSLRSGIENQPIIHEGFYPYRRAVWQRMVDEATSAELREHVGLVMREFIDELKQQWIDEAPIYSQVKHRISVDTISDYQFMSAVYRRWYRDHDAQTIVSLPWVIEQLQQDAQLTAINQKVLQRDPSQIAPNVLIVTQCGQQYGLGHLARSCVLARQFQDQMAAGVSLLVQGDRPNYPALDLFPHQMIDWQTSLIAAVQTQLSIAAVDVIIFDLAILADESSLRYFLQQVAFKSVVKVAVDGLFQLADQWDYIHVPSFYLAAETIKKINPSKLGYGWDYYLLAPVTEAKVWQPGSKILVMTGGSDEQGLGQQWPALLDQSLPETMEIIWVRGPYAPAPDVPTQARLNWQVLNAPSNLQEIMPECDYALCMYGVSFFELLQHGVPSVVWCANEKLKQEMQALKGQAVAQVAASIDDAVVQLNRLVRDDQSALACHQQAVHLLANQQGSAVLVDRVSHLLEQNKT